MRFAGVMSTARAQMRVYEPLTHRAEDGHEPCQAAAMASTQHTPAKVLVVDDELGVHGFSDSGGIRMRRRPCLWHGT